MKKHLTLLLLFAGFLAAAQTPQGLNYQAIYRDASGVAKANQNVTVQFSVLDGAVNGTLVFQENQTAVTNQFGLFNMTIGQGNLLWGSFSGINWGSGPKFLKTEVNGSLLGTAQLMAVPYALYAEKTNIQVGTGLGQNGSLIFNTGDLSNTNELQYLSVSGSTLSISGGNSVNLPSATTYSAGNGITINGTTINNAGDLSTTNELQLLNMTGNTLSISNGNTVTLPAAPSYTAGSGISIAGNTIAAADNSATNELQNLSVAGNTLSISGGNSVTLPGGGGTSFWKANGDDIENTNADRVFVGTNAFPDDKTKFGVLGDIYASYPLGVTPAQIDDYDWDFGNAGISTLVHGDTYIRNHWGINIDRCGNYSGQYPSPLNTLHPDNGSLAIRKRISNTAFRTDLIVRENGDVGIGTVSPATRLDVMGVITTRDDSTLVGGRINFGNENHYIKRGNGYEPEANDITINTPNNPIHGNIILLDGGFTANGLHQNIGNVGINTPSPKAKLHVANGDVYVENLGSGIIMKSPNGNCWRMTVSDAGLPQFTAIICPQ